MDSFFMSSDLEIFLFFASFLGGNIMNGFSTTEDVF